MMSPMQHEPSIVLPSIRDMFPEYLMKDPLHSMIRPSSQRSSMSPSLPQGSIYPPSVSPPLAANARRHSSASGSPPTGPSRVPRLHQASTASTKNLHLNSPSHPFNRRNRSNSVIRSQVTDRSDSAIFSFDVLRSDPSSSSLQHIASSATFPNRGGSSAGYSPQGEISNGSAPVFRVSVPDSSPGTRGAGNFRPHRSHDGLTPAARKIEPTGTHTITSPGPGFSTIISFPVSDRNGAGLTGRDRSPDDPDNASDGDLSGSNNGKKHMCPTCSKRFNRPSSLRIHVNTHTGERPFRCPWPNCAREFNVNSNMRRHYRNHTTPGFARPQANDNRRRRKQGSSRGLVFVPDESRQEVQSTGTFMTPPISSLSMNEDSDDVSEVDTNDEEEDELDSLPDEASPVYERAERPYLRSSESSDQASYVSQTISRYSQSHMRSENPAASSYHAPSLSPSHSQDHIYSPSAPYSRSFADSKVSTALRPAFHAKPVSGSR
ncbi:hypothetical protein D9615_009621 [Tricholomella constricta]|uniref:C2H2-type domain-containing protein n=1 Tax=Tricholomella constricta TaxID=117010 RepID=A0A8H5GV43_9AGAR|nr:hypothetical protein D9615_009621 [Tricholomella constricta]